MLKIDKSFNLLCPSHPAGTKELVILVQNGKEKALKVNLTVESTNHALEIPKHQTERVWILLANFLFSAFSLMIYVVTFSELLGPLLTVVSWFFILNRKVILGSKLYLSGK